MQVFLPTDVAKHATNKYLGVLSRRNLREYSTSFRATARRPERKSSRRARSRISLKVRFSIASFRAAAPNSSRAAI